MPEIVYHKLQVGAQAGTVNAPGALVPASVLIPVSEPVVIDLDRATTYPAQDWGRNAAARAATGFHGVRGASFPVQAHKRFEDVMYWAESHLAGDIIPTDIGGGYFRWVYPLEVGLPTIVPKSVQSGTESTLDQWAAVGALIDELTFSFDDLEAPGAHPWMIDSSWLALNRVANPFTELLDLPTGLETMQGQNSRIHLGPLSEPFGDLEELAASLISFNWTSNKHLELRAYGGDEDGAESYGFSEKTSGTATFKIRISNASKTRVYDEWENGSPFADDVRIRIRTPGSASKVSYLDFALGMTGVPVGTRGGERVYEVTGNLLDEEELDAMGQLTVENTVSALATGYGS